jgi:outer membrane protein, heavy metal efflux system
MKRMHLLITPLYLVTGLIVMGFSPTRGSQDSLSNLVTEALQNNPGVKALDFKVKSLHSSIDHFWWLEPPEVGIDFFQTPTASFPNPIKNQMEIDYSIKQAFPFPGKIKSRINVEHTFARMSEAELEIRKRKIIREVKTTYYELYLLDRKIIINQENQALISRLVAIARRQYEVGMGRQSDILGAQSELTKLKSDSISLYQSKLGMQAMLNSLLNRKVNLPISVTDTLIPFNINWTLDQIQPILKKVHPELQGMDANIRMREAEKTLLRKELLPDIMIGGMFKDMLVSPPGSHSGPPENYWSVMASMNIPFALWSLPKYRAQNAQSKANMEQARLDYQDTENMLNARVYGALLKTSSTQELLRLSKEVLLPQAQQALESNLAGYQGGKGEFMGLIDAYRMRLMARENFEMSLMQLMVSQAELEEAIGLSLQEIAKEVSKGDAK